MDKMSARNQGLGEREHKTPMDSFVKGRTLREWFGYLNACANLGLIPYGVPAEINEAWQADQARARNKNNRHGGGTRRG